MTCLRFDEKNFGFALIREGTETEFFRAEHEYKLPYLFTAHMSGRLLYADFIIAVVNPEPSLNEQNDSRQ